MLTIQDQVRIRLKQAEFFAPTLILRAGLQTGTLSNPYLKEDDALSAIFIHVPKAAGKSIRSALYDRKSFHIPAVRYHAANPGKFGRYFKFCFVRNPWDRFFSAYNYLKRRCDADMNFPDHRWAATYLRNCFSFEDFVLKLNESNYRSCIRRYIHFRDQLDWISSPGRPRKILMDYVGRYETLESDYAEIARGIGKINDLPLGWLGSGKNGGRYRSAYTMQMVDVIADIYKTDIEAFDYEFE